MKVKSFLAAMAAATLAIISFSSCQNDDDTPAPSIDKQWVIDIPLSEAETSDGMTWMKILVDVNVTKENTVTIGMMNDIYATMLGMYVEAGMLESFNAETDFMITDEMSITNHNQIDANSGTITCKSAANGETYTVSYSGLSDTSVLIESDGETLPCTAATIKYNFISLEM